MISTATLRGRAIRWPAVSLLVSGSVLALFALPGLAGTIEWQRASVLDHEWWRILTGHLSHTSVPNLFWNLATFLVLGAICETQNRRRFLLATVLTAVTVPMAVLLAAPETTAYRGLSGIDSALFGLLLVTVVRKAWDQERRSLAVLLCGTGVLFLGKIAYEVTTQQALFAVDSSGFVPLPLAHLAGAAVGLLVALLPLHQRRASDPSGSGLASERPSPSTVASVREGRTPPTAI